MSSTESRYTRHPRLPQAGGRGGTEPSGRRWGRNGWSSSATSCCVARVLKWGDDLFAEVAVALHDEVHVLGEDRAGEDDVAAFGDGAGEAAGDGGELGGGEADRIVTQTELLGAAQVAVVVASCDRGAGRHLCCGAVQI